MQPAGYDTNASSKRASSECNAWGRVGALLLSVLCSAVAAAAHAGDDLSLIDALARAKQLSPDVALL